MTLDPELRLKADPLLEEALERAEGPEILSAVMVLEPSGQGGPVVDDGPPPHPADFPSRTAYRQALIERQQRRLSQELGSTLEALRKRALNPRGGTISHTVVVEGEAQRLLEALKLPGVRHASLDRGVSLVQPHRRGEPSSGD